MATMVKEKYRDKKKSKDKHKSKKLIEQDTEDAETSTLEPNESLTQTQSVTEAEGISEKCDNLGNIHLEDDTTLAVDTDLRIDNVATENDSERDIEKVDVIVVPSAPVLEQNEAIPYIAIEEVQEVVKTRVKCLPLEEVVQIFGGREIAEVRAISEMEEAIVEAGPQSRPDHPLIDLLSTFKTSLVAVERERNRISCRYIEEDKARLTLWEVEKRTVNISEKCDCGANINVRASFDVAKLNREKMAAARLRLEALLQDVQDSYCHHQHTALQTHCEIDEVVSETIKQPKECIREALALVFEALRFSDAAPEAYAQALQRWASVLATALLEEENYNHIFFVLHHLFRQSRSVQWAGRALRLRAADARSPARLLALLELLLARAPGPPREGAEDGDAWEELDDRGEGCAVGEGRLRERDLLALLAALPLRDFLARLTLFPRQDVRGAAGWGDACGGQAVLAASGGARAALRVLARAGAAHARYGRLRARLRRLAAALLRALTALHDHARSSYREDLRDRIAAELEACFAAGFSLLEDEADQLPATLLSDDVAGDYCNSLIAGLHEKCVHIPSLSVESREQACGVRVRIVACAATSRPLDRELAGTVLNFLFQTGIHRKAACAGGCDVSARELLPQLLAAHAHLHTRACHLLADSSQVDADSGILEPLLLQHWRPTPSELTGVLDDWALRCPQLLQHLLLKLDYTPFTGVSLESQLRAGEWLCSWAERRGSEPEWAWRVLRALRVHAAHWSSPPRAPPTDPAPAPADTACALRAAFSLLASEWGHSVPLICGPGADALLQLAQSRPLDALHCTGLLMRVMAQSPESISLTPKFTEIFATLLGAGASLVQRALGRAAPAPLRELVLEQLRDARLPAAERGALLSAWLHALWAPALPAAARAALDAALRDTRDWRTLDAHAAMLLREPNAKEYVVDAVRHAPAAPLLCEALLRGALAAELGAPPHARLLDELARQRAAAQKIHVDNALKQIGSSLTDDELAIHRCASALLAARAQHPAHALLWRLLLHAWLQRRSENSPPVGPLFFSGIVKSRTLAQLKKRLQETAVYHRGQVDVLKAESSTPSSEETTNKLAKSNSTTDDSLFETLSILDDLTGESISESESIEVVEENENENVNESQVKRDIENLITYHTGAEKMVREYLLWLEEGESVRAHPHHADIGRYLSEQALDAAWRASLDPPPPAPPPPLPPLAPALSDAHLTHFERALAAINSVEDSTSERYKVPAPTVTISESVAKDPFLLLQMIEKYIDELTKLNDEWAAEAARARALDAALWGAVEALRVRRALPPARAACARACAPRALLVPEDEWCVSPGAEQAVRENRRSARAALRRLARPRPHAARVACALLAAGRRVSSARAAERAAELAWRAAPLARQYAPARDALDALVDGLAQRWLNGDSALTCALLLRWCAAGAAGARARLCGRLLRPARVAAAQRARLHAAVLALPLPPHEIFSYLTRFDMNEWAEQVDSAARGEVLESLVKAAIKIGPDPEEQQLVLLELLGVQAAAAARARELCAHVRRCARACAAAALAPHFAAHLPRCLHRARELHVDQIGQLLHELGAVWWEARSSAPAQLLAHAAHAADTLHALLREFVAAAVRATYTPERVAHCSWRVLEASWAPWLGERGGRGAELRARFVDAIHVIVEDCPGSTEAVLWLAWQWAARAAAGGAGAGGATGELLAQLARLPWRSRWLRADCVPAALQVCGIPDPATRAWFGERLRHAPAECWLRGAAGEQLAPALAALLALFTSALPVVPAEALEGVCELPWERLPLPALEAALQRYFVDHRHPDVPYHELPHFKVLLAAARLVLREPDGGAGGRARALGVAHWARAAAEPASAGHALAHARRLLAVLADLAPSVDPDELVALLSCALSLLGAQLADPLGLPEWERWLRGARGARAAGARAAGALTALDLFAPLADVVARVTMDENDEAPDWSDVWERLECTYGEAPAGALAARGRLHAAYAALRAREPSCAGLREALHALSTVEIDFIQNEAIVSVWICVAGRACWRRGAGGAREGADARAAEQARALLAAWAARRRSLLQLVTLQAAASCPTANHQLLCRLALCVGAPGEAAARAYETARSACAASPAPSAARAGSLPRLAARLLPGREHYFAHELQLALDFESSSQTSD